MTATRNASAGAGFLSPVHEQFAAALGKALTDAAIAKAKAGSWAARVTAAPQSQAANHGAPSAWVAVQLQGDLPGEVLLGLNYDEAAVLLGSQTEVEPSEVDAAWVKLVSAAHEHVVQLLEPEFGSVRITSATASAPKDASLFAELRLEATGSAERVTIGAVLDRTLAGSLGRLSSATHALSGHGARSGAPEGTERLHRVIDVPLAVTLRFGQRQMTVRELLALSTGSLVELDRQVEEPVELVLGERIVARGEVVIVDGNYGLRVLEVVEGSSPTASQVRA